MKILIYSASGLIGINLVKKLSSISLNNQIYLVSDRTIPTLFFTKMGINLQNIKIVPDLEKLEIEFDEIYHCGYSSQPDIFLNNPLVTIEKNISITPWSGSVSSFSTLCEIWRARSIEEGKHML
jgi:nucleoside-diphosphate-sugar epimerase